MAFQDLREYIKKLEEIGEVKHINKADWNLEVGTISEMMVEQGGPALIFDEVKGYPAGYRIATNLYGTTERQALSLGLSTVSENKIEYIRKWRNIANEFKPVPPVKVKTGPIMENVHVGDEVDVYEFPTPKWHELDGGRYIGTGCVVIVRDPDEDWVNFGTYRVQIHDKQTVSSYMNPSQHGNMIRQKYWERGLSCPVAIALGQDPAVWAASVYFLTWGISEYDFAGYLRGEPVEVVEGMTTGLPIPASAEIVIEGEIPPPDIESRIEGPFGEWTGYYGHGARLEPILKVKSVLHRNNPILQGNPPYKPPNHFAFDLWVWHASRVWDDLERAGITDVKGVYAMPAAGGQPIIVVSIKQRYGGHATRTGLVTSGCQGGAYLGRFVIIVDDDIDPSNTDEVLWALASRCDPATSMTVLTGCLSGPLDPRMDPDEKEKGNFTNSRVIINACRPYHWKDKYPPVNKASAELRKQIMDKWGDLFNLKA